MPDNTRIGNEDVYKEPCFVNQGTSGPLCCAAAGIYSGYLKKYFSKRPRGARDSRMQCKALFPACLEDWGRQVPLSSPLCPLSVSTVPPLLLLTCRRGI